MTPAVAEPPTVHALPQDADNAATGTEVPVSITDIWARQRAEHAESGSMLERLLIEQAESLPDLSVLDSAARPAALAADLEAGNPSIPTVKAIMKLSACQLFLWMA
ncbi:MAG: hypothetical protein HZT40_21795 [Candidatus Thiothrix singaporensis]|uniref:Uncharacterized protein n=1 Tax=Candidatus Thiothrix singaporensis TaxID=2799669 RepID=A0A7L6AXX4_9GAMM|nr:MAG: hypothetical protein HZT40_21795 [Candidatus Thiothrix singaporensis]